MLHFIAFFVKDQSYKLQLASNFRLIKELHFMQFSVSINLY